MKLSNPTAVELLTMIHEQMAKAEYPSVIVLLTKRELKLLKNHFATQTYPKEFDLRGIRLHNKIQIMGLEVVRCKHPPERRVYA